MTLMVATVSVIEASGTCDRAIGYLLTVVAHEVVVSLKLEGPVKDTQSFTSAMHAVVDDLQLFFAFIEFHQLSHIRSPWQIKHKVIRNFRVCLVQMLQIVGLHVRKIEDIPIGITWTWHQSVSTQNFSQLEFYSTHLPTAGSQK